MRFVAAFWQSIPVAVRAVITGLVILVCGALGWSAITFGSLRLAASVSWASGPLGLAAGSLFLWGYWRYLGGAWWPQSSAEVRRSRLRANPLPHRVWTWALITGAVATASFVSLVTVWGWIVRLQPWSVPGVSHLFL